MKMMGPAVISDFWVMSLNCPIMRRFTSNGMLHNNAMMSAIVGLPRKVIKAAPAPSSLSNDTTLPSAISTTGTRMGRKAQPAPTLLSSSCEPS